MISNTWEIGVYELDMEKTKTMNNNCLSYI